MEKDDSRSPLVSICVPAFNCDKFIGATIACLCRQTYVNLEIIVVNDGSTDNTASVIAAYQDDRIQLIQTNNGGAAKARNLAFGQATGEYVIFFDADDFIPGNFVEMQVGLIFRYPQSVVLSSWGRFYIDDFSSFQRSYSFEGQIGFEDWINLHWSSGDAMTNPGRAILPRKVLALAGGWNESLGLYDDLEFFTRVFLTADQIIYNPDAELYYRSGVNGLSAAKSRKDYESAYHAIDLSITQALAGLAAKTALLRSYANMWQLFAYEIYPVHMDLYKKVKRKVVDLGGADIPFRSGGYTKAFAAVIGWKMTKRLKRVFNFGPV